MKNTIKLILLIISVLFVYEIYSFSSIKIDDLPVITIYPEIIYTGNPIFITINASTTPREIKFNNKNINFSKFGDKYLGIIGIDFNDKNTQYEISVKLENGMNFKEYVNIKSREKIEKPLGIPAKLGGNTKEASSMLISNLAIENAELNNIKSANKSLWTDTFEYPISNVFVTDEYGYNRKTVDQTIVHKGTDFRAIVGTPVMSINDGVVKISKKFTVYGNTIVIDHGNGILSLYMHLSQLSVKAGENVKSGQLVGYSGDTGYAEAPHLHISIKINSISIDPMVFMKYFKK